MPLQGMGDYIYKKARDTGELIMLLRLIKSGSITETVAAEEMEISQEAFSEIVREYTLYDNIIDLNDFSTEKVLPFWKAVDEIREQRKQ